MYLCLFVLAVFGGGIHIPYTFTGLAYAHDFDPVRQAETNKYLDTEHDENCDNDEGIVEVLLHMHINVCCKILKIWLKYHKS